MLLFVLLLPFVTGGLVDRLAVASVETDEVFGKNTEYQFRFTREYPGGVQETWPIYTDVDPTGTVRIAWTAKSRNVHVTTITSDGKRVGDDLVLQTSEKNPIRYVRGLACTDDGGFALLVIWPHEGEEHAKGMVWFILFDSGAKEVTRKIVDRRSNDFKLGDGVLKFGNNEFRAYLKITGQNPGASHEGDTLLHIDATGVEEDPIWNWGCSHPQMNELVYNPTLKEFGAFCTSDKFPARGIIFNKATVLRETYGTDGGHVASGLGDIVPTETGYLLSFIAPNDENPTLASWEKKKMDVGLMHVLANGDIEWTKWITSTPDHEHSVHLAAYEDGYLLAWAQIPNGKVPYRAAGNHLFIAKLDKKGEIVGQQENVTGKVDWQERPNFVTLPNGAVAWTAGFGFDENNNAQQGYYHERQALQFVTIRPETFREVRPAAEDSGTPQPSSSSTPQPPSTPPTNAEDDDQLTNTPTDESDASSSTSLNGLLLCCTILFVGLFS